MINDLGKELETGTKISQFADDSAIWATNKNIKKLEQTLQKSLDKIEKWTKDWRIKLSISKTTGMLFEAKQIQNNKINITSSIY